MNMNLWLNLGMLAAVAALAGGCCGMGGEQRHRTTNLSAYLYPDHPGPVEASAPVALSAPVRVGIAFVPVNAATNDRFAYANAGSSYASAGAGPANSASAAPPPLSGNDRLDLMRQITSQCGEFPSIKSAALIPGDDLVAGGGFANLDRLRELYGIDVIVLLAYNQAQFADEGALSLSYWTLVGAYLVPAEKIDTKTVMEGAVYDIVSRKLLCRATGEAELRGSSTPVNLSEQLRLDGKKGFQAAASNLVGDLKLQMAEFEKQAASSPGQYRIERSAGGAEVGIFGGRP